jgi:hypothetical protein
MSDTKNLKGDTETKRLKFFAINEVPDNLMDSDLIDAYQQYLNKK